MTEETKQETTQADENDELRAIVAESLFMEAA